MKKLLIATFLAVVAVAAPTAGSSAPQPLVADLSSSRIAISTGFAGTDLLLFGAIDQPGDVIVVVRGPARTESVRRKGRVLAIWVNRERVIFQGVPAFYWVAGTRPISELATPAKLAALSIGAEHLHLKAMGGAGRDIEPFRAAFLRGKKRQGLYGGGALVRIKDNRLFRTTVHFPATVPVGEYIVTVHLLRNGEVTATRDARLTIRKSGIEAEVYGFAHERSALYGIICIVIAIVAGWTAGAVFRRS